MLAVVAIALGVALATHAAGLSLGLGAFLAGIVVSETDFEEQVLADIIPIRDIFATLFFVAVGMLIDPFALIAQWQLVLGFALVLVIGKLLIIGGALLAAGVDHRTSTLAAVFMAQMGEFSFVLAGSGFEHGLIDIGKYGTILSVALCSILAMPILVAISPSCPNCRAPAWCGATGAAGCRTTAASGAGRRTRRHLRVRAGGGGDRRGARPLGPAVQRHRAQPGDRARPARSRHRRVVRRCGLARRVGERGGADGAHRRGNDA